MESPSRGSSTTSTPKRSASSSQGLQTSSPTRGAAVPVESGAKTGNAFSKFFSQLKSLIAEAATNTSDEAPGVDHCCKTSRCHYGLPIHHDSELALSCASATSSSTSFPQVSTRLIVYRDCDRRGRKILFDSDHVSSDYVYLKPTDPKLLKDLGEYVFGCVPLASASNPTMDFASSGHKRFCKWNLEDPSRTMYIWSKIIELGSYNRSRNQNSMSCTTVDYSSSSSEQSSSGYESGGSSSKTFSLPLINPRPTSRSSSHQSFPETRSLPGRIDSYRTNLALVWIYTLTHEENLNGSLNFKIPFLYLSPLVEKLMLNPLSSITKNFYQNTTHFVSSLKNVASNLHHDLTDFLGNPHVVNLTLVKPPLTDMVNPKLVTRLLELIFTNTDSCIVLNLKKWTEVKAILYFIKMFLRTCVCKCSLFELQKENIVETGTDVASTNELDCVDSGIELESSSKLRSISTSSVYGRKWSIVSEESELSSSQEEGCDGRVSFHLGDADVDQSEARLELGEVDISRLKGERRGSVDSTSSTEVTFNQDNPSPVKRPPQEVQLTFSDTKVRDSCSVKYTPCYHCNGTYITETTRFNPFYFVQVMAKPAQVSYDFEYISFMKIIELYGSGSVRSFNVCEEGSGTSTTEEDGNNNNELGKKIKEFVEGYVTLSKVTNDTGKLDSFVSFQMEEIMDILY